jgi:hypothetical protein
MQIISLLILSVSGFHQIHQEMLERQRAQAAAQAQPSHSFFTDLIMKHIDKYHNIQRDSPEVTPLAKNDL